MLGSVRASTLNYAAVKLFSKYSILCETETVITVGERYTDGRRDGQTGGRTIFCGITALCVAPRSKNWVEFEMFIFENIGANSMYFGT